MARLRWVFTASTTRGTRIPNQSGKEDSFTCGNTKTGRGKSRGSSVTTTTPRPSNGHEPSEDLRGRQYVWGRASQDTEKIHEQHQGDAASNADDGAGVVRVDGGGSGNFRKAGHQHHVAGDHDDEAGSGGQRGVGDVERPAGRSAETFRIVGEGVLRFGDADGQFSITPFREVPPRVTPTTMESRRLRRSLRSFASATMAMISEAAVMMKPVWWPPPSFLLSSETAIRRNARSFMSTVRGQVMRWGSRCRSLPWKSCASISAASKLWADAMA